MKTIELIKVRTGNSHSQEMLDVLQQILAAATENVQTGGSVNLYQHGTIPGDYAYFLFQNGKTIHAEGSPLAIRIRKSLESSGMVDYTTWALIE